MPSSSMPSSAVMRRSDAMALRVSSASVVQPRSCAAPGARGATGGGADSTPPGTPSVLGLVCSDSWKPSSFPYMWYSDSCVPLAKR